MYDFRQHRITLRKISIKYLYRTLKMQFISTKIEYSDKTNQKICDVCFKLLLKLFLMQNLSIY